MSVEALGFLLTQGVQVPFVKGEISELATFAVVCNLAWHADLDGFVWVSDRTQEREIPPHRSTIWSIRRLLISEGWLKYTGQRKQKGVKVFKLEIPGFSFSGFANPTTTKPNVLDSDLTTGSTSGSTSGLASGLASGLFCGLPYQAEKNIKTNEIKEYNQFQKNNLDHLPDNVREMIIRKRRLKGSYPENNEITLGEALKPVVENLEKPTTDNEPF